MRIQGEIVDVLLQFRFNKLKLIEMCIDWFIVDNSNIGEVGVKKLIEGEWPALKDINLRK